MEKNDLDEIYFELHRRKNIEKWKIDISELKDCVYSGNIEAPEDITEFKGFKEELGIEINNVTVNTNVRKVQNCINEGMLRFRFNPNLKNVKNLPRETDGLIFVELKNVKNITFGNISTKEIYLNGLNTIKKLDLRETLIECELSISGCTVLEDVKLSRITKRFHNIYNFICNNNLKSISGLPYYVERLSLYKLPKLEYIEMPKRINSLQIENCPFFENMDEDKIREKYGIRK